MVKFSIYYFRDFSWLLLIIISQNHSVFSQGNCLIYPEDSGERIACELSYRAVTYKQGSKESQLLFSKAIELGPKYAWAYYEKSVPFFKRGYLAEGISLINKSIELEPENYLNYRAYWYFYNRSYDFAIKDLEKLYNKHKISFCLTPGGEMEMRLLLAISYAAKGNTEKGIHLITNLMKSYKSQPHLKGLYDHYVLGVLYYQNNQYKLAEIELKQQLIINETFADTYYYLGLIKEQQNRIKLSKDYYEKALERFDGKKGGYSINLFTEFNLYKKDVESKLKNDF